jgi:hypothetical protein
MTHPTIQQFDGALVRKIMEETEKALKPIAEKYGLVLDRKGRTYHRDSCPVMYQFLVKETGARGEVLTAAAKDFQKYAARFGLAATDLGREFRRNGTFFRIVGMKPKSHKYPVLAMNVSTGKTFKFAAEDVETALKLAA